MCFAAVQPHDLQSDVRAWSDEEWEEALLPAIVALSFRLLKYKCNMKQRFPPRHWRPALTDDLQLHFDDRVQSAFWGGRSGATNTIRSRPCLSAALVCLCSICFSAEIQSVRTQ